LSWLLTLPLVVAGSQLAHAVAYWVAVPDAHERAAVLAPTGHGYFAYAPFLGGVGIATVAAALALHVRGVGAARPRAWPFALLPLLTFIVQEQLERGVALDVFAEQTFLYGTALQLPFGLVALLIARALVRAAERVAEVLRRAPRLRMRPRTILSPLSPTPFCAVLLVAGSGVRGPPPLP
jgi:glycerol-3-phosphate acyltransferase PlsY